MARRKVGSLTGLARLQRLVTSQNVKRQTVNAMKQMQLLVRVQTQIQSQRIQTLKNQALKPQPKSNKHHKEADEEDWDDSLITKEEREARLKRKEEALIKRERAMAYAYSHQSLKGTPTTSAHLIGGYPWWWKWLEHQLPYHASPILKKHQYATTPSRSRPRTPTTPMSSKSTNPYSKARKGASPSPYPMTDNDSLMSCPPFSVPNYMSPTASARAKARPTSNPKERCLTPTTPRSETSNRRFSYPLNNRHKSPGSIGDLSMDSMPASVGRKPFNRFV
ncbi:hypothetical protein QVD17_01172 [Tagetes erecta]|uniref:DUF4005 domain-containing protein n=1 Tax=Tagetes erecta TaxID=13708 RepID=A0AAD8P7P0_TARER|nr:hypothetical protein QVD17_01172 [Tagetes erecta]